MKLSHHTKVTVRKALKALRTFDAMLYSQERTDLIMYCIHKAGFQTREQLETFARKHHLL